MRASAIAAMRASMVLAAAFRSRALSLAKNCSIRLKSGLNTANANYLQAHKDVVARYMKAYRETVNYMYTDTRDLGRG